MTGTGEVRRKNGDVRRKKVRDKETIHTRFDAGGFALLACGTMKKVKLVSKKPKLVGKIDWMSSAALRRDRSGERILTAKESAALLAENSGKW
jgi:hypothetical protein